MYVASLALRDFRCYSEARVRFAEGLTVITGPNGAGKSNLLEGIYFGCTGRSCRTANERELVRFGASTTRAAVAAVDQDGAHELSVGFTPGQPKRLRIDGASVERLIDAPGRPLLSVFLPDRLDLVKGAPALRRAHLDQVSAALWPARTHLRRAYSQALAQRNALISRIRAGHANRDSLRSWDEQLARCGVELMRQREQTAQRIAGPSGEIAAMLGLDGLLVRYRPRSRACDAAQLFDELAERVDQDLARGFTSHGPHRDELSLRLAEREVRAFASQGQQRVALLSLLLAEREVIAARRARAPVMLLDDVMSELDLRRRESLVELLRSRPGQAVITATELDQIPGSTEPDVARLMVLAGSVRDEVTA